MRWTNEARAFQEGRGRGGRGRGKSSGVRVASSTKKEKSRLLGMRVEAREREGERGKAGREGFGGGRKKETHRVLGIARQPTLESPGPLGFRTPSVALFAKARAPKLARNDGGCSLTVSDVSTPLPLNLAKSKVVKSAEGPSEHGGAA